MRRCATLVVLCGCFAAIAQALATDQAATADREGNRDTEKSQDISIGRRLLGVPRNPTFPRRPQRSSSSPPPSRPPTPAKLAGYAATEVNAEDFDDGYGPNTIFGVHQSIGNFDQWVGL